MKAEEIRNLVAESLKENEKVSLPLIVQKIRNNFGSYVKARVRVLSALKKKGCGFTIEKDGKTVYVRKVAPVGS